MLGAAVAAPPDRLAHLGRLMSKRRALSPLSKVWRRTLRAATGQVLRATQAATREVVKTAAKKVAAAQTASKPPSDGRGDWIAGLTLSRSGPRRYRLFRPAGIASGARVPLVVMLHGCGQDAAGIARSTRMNRVAAREGFFVLYPEQSRLANPQRCWNWFETESGRAQEEMAQILAAIDQTALLYPMDRARVAIAGLSAGAGMAALLATAHPDRFRAVAMHSGVPPGLASSTPSALRAMRGLASPPDIAAPPVGPPDATRGAARGAASDAPSWPPLLVIQGTRDRVVARVNAGEAVRQWSVAAGASARAAREVQRGKRHPMTVTDFKRGSVLAATLVEIDGLAHAWSGGAAKEAFSDPAGPDATAMIWRFFAKHLR